MKVENNVKKEENIIETWKEQHGKIYKSIIDGEEYIWRRIKRKEYSDVMISKDSENVDERIYLRQLEITKLVVLNFKAEELDDKLNEMAGLATTLSEEVLDKSGFNLTATYEL